MAVVEQQAPERVPQSQHLQLGVSSLLGAALVLFVIAFVLGGLPSIWEYMLHVGEDVAANRPPVINEFLSDTLLLIVMAVVGAGCWFFLRAVDRSSSQPGLRAGVFMGAVAFYVVLGLATKLGWAMAPPDTDEFNVVNFVIFAMIAGAMVFGVGWLFTRAGFERWLVRIEGQGWFHMVSYKGNQGVRVRRGTIVALLTVGVCGIITLVTHRSLGSSRVGANDWNWELPFTDLYLPLMHQIHITLPILLSIGALWVAWRVVNWPAFADFLIATEAEINKVSWTTRRRLMQDTVVVLVTVFLFTTFLFVVDIIWIKVLTSPYIQVLQLDIKEAFQKQQEKTQW